MTYYYYFTHLRKDIMSTDKPDMTRQEAEIEMLTLALSDRDHRCSALQSLVHAKLALVAGEGMEQAMYHVATAQVYAMLASKN
jgi:hypothetical protein